MYKHDYLKIGVVTPFIKLGKCLDNAYEIIKVVKEVKDASIMLFPELTISGCMIGNWHHNFENIIEEKKALKYIVENSDNKVLIIGSSFVYNDNLYDCAFVIQNKRILGIVPKSNLNKNSDINEFSYFTSGDEFLKYPIMVKYLDQEVMFGQNIFKNYEYDVVFGVDLSNKLMLNNKILNSKPHIVFNLFFNAYYLGKHEVNKSMVVANSNILGGSYICVSNGASETASDVIFTGAQIVAQDGKLIIDKEYLNLKSNYNLIDIDIQNIKHNHLSNFNDIVRDENCIKYDLYKTDDFYFSNEINKYPFVINNDDNAKEIIDVLTLALYHRLIHIGSFKVVIGVSGGLDSTFALLIAYECFKKYKLPLSNIVAFSMPGLATGSKSQNIALDLMNALGVKGTVLSIANEVKNHFNLIGHDESNKDTTYENTQARYRTLVLMNVANSCGGIVLGTGDMSEIALGWSTFNGDQMSMYNINAGLPKTAIKSLVGYFARKYNDLAFILTDVINATISPELTSSNQSTEDLIGKYEINDFIMYHVLKQGDDQERITFLLERIFNLSSEVSLNYYNNFVRRFKINQFKRLASPEGVKIFELSLSSHGEFKFPGDMK